MSTAFSIEKILHLRSSRPFPKSNIGGRLSVRKRKYIDPNYIQLQPLGVPSRMLLRKNNTMLEFMTNCIQHGPHYDRKETK
jgi:hypothetical protein